MWRLGLSAEKLKKQARARFVDLREEVVMAVRFLQEDSALTCLVVLFCYYYGGSGDGGDDG